IRRWDSTKPIIYSFDGSHTLREQRVIELALEHWHNITCLNFERKDDEPKGSRIVFTDVDGCASNVGRHPLGEPQFVSLAPECIRYVHGGDWLQRVGLLEEEGLGKFREDNAMGSVIAHEVAHALGFWHEQSRPDRDLWVQVQWDNIDRDSQFLKEQPSDVDNSGVPYDYGSIMHYRSKAFAKLDDLFTIGTFIVDYQRTIGQRDQLSFNDIRLMNGGYTDPRHCERCRCPDGFTGAVMPGYGAECGGRIEVGQSWTKISSPNYPGEFREGQECSWLYCCYGTPTSPVHSATNDLLVLFRSFYRGGRGFQAKAKAINPSRNGWSVDTETQVCAREPCPGNELILILD
uniref:Metalloendopeptidase n=1 Tax=Meloidogyne javanica TaxID=6303 RepID=A0A915M988_MELJA